jgi:hypothetical protein
LASQVDPAQLLACSQAGYGGNSDFYSQVTIDYGGPLGSPDLNPIPFDPSMLSNHPGLSGVGAAGGWLPAVGAGIGLVGLLWIAEKMASKRKGR